MITFTCTGCASKMSIADTQAGKLITCPACKTKVQVPSATAAPEASASPNNPPVPLPKPAPASQPAPVHETDVVKPIDDEDEGFHEEGRGFNANRIRGVVGIVVGIGLLIFALTFAKFKEPGKFAFGEYGTPVGCTLGGLLVVTGIFYLIRG